MVVRGILRIDCAAEWAGKTIDPAVAGTVVSLFHNARLFYITHGYLFIGH